MLVNQREFLFLCWLLSWHHHLLAPSEAARARVLAPPPSVSMVAATASSHRGSSRGGLGLWLSGCLLPAGGLLHTSVTLASLLLVVATASSHQGSSPRRFWHESRRSLPARERRARFHVLLVVPTASSHIGSSRRG